jgi:hypothetical protein
VSSPEPGYTASGPDRRAEEPAVPFEVEIAAAVREEKRISASVLLALAVVGLVIVARLVFF